MSLQKELVSNLYRDFVAKQDQIIKKAITDAGFDADNNTFLSTHLTIVQWEGDPFDHLFYHFGKPDQVRIISIQRTPDCNSGVEFGELFKPSVTAKYY